MQQQNIHSVAKQGYNSILCFRLSKVKNDRLKVSKFDRFLFTIKRYVLDF